ncbi:uncharacterized protein LOC134209834 [Armigeres subalbatus]|uniref:uncharacterized protein LOC134209834 n=1 Tax=Armigeres subalbatus TaxID=124917 RepID=UPI002ED270AC
MVFCDHCQQWYHFGCVGVTAEVKDISWCCQKCSGGGSDDSGSSELQEEFKKLEKEKKKQKRELEREKILHRKRLEVQQELFEMRQQLEKEKQDMELEFEKAQMEKKIAEEEAHQRKLDEMRTEMEEKLQQLKLKRRTETDTGKKESKGAVGGVSKSGTRKIAELEHSKLGKNLEKKKSGNKKPRKADAAIAKFNDPRGAYRKHSTPTVAQQLAPKSVGDPSTFPESFLIGRDGNSTPVGRPGVPKPEKVKRSNKWQIAEEESESETSSEEVEDEESAKRKEDVPPRRKRALRRRKKIVRRRKVRRVPKKRKENLARLQECLKGEALEAVRSRLLLPKSVPKIIETLQMLYGRPERLLNMLLAKVRNAAPPKADRLASFIGFGVVVQQLSDHLEATGLTSHLVNPMLIQELIEKLPAGTQLEWVRYRRKSKVVTLRTLSNFLSRIVKDASEVAAYGEASRSGEVGSKKVNPRSRASEGYIHAHDAAESISSSPPAKERRPCRICGRVDHRIRNCERFRRLHYSERWEAVRRWKLCQLCLNEHGTVSCKLNFRCNIGGCKERHNPLLHPPRSVAGSNCNIHAIQPKPSVIFRMMPVTLHSGIYSVNTFAFLDEGSSYTLVENTLIDRLRIRGVTQPLRVTWTAGVSRVEKDSQCVNMLISARGSAQRFFIKSAHTVESLKLPQHSLAVSEVVKQYSHLQDLPIADVPQTTPQILIGLKDIHLYAPIESRIGRPEEPIAVRSKLGWTVYGPTGANATEGGIVGHHACSSVTNQELHDLLKSQYALEESGISVALLPESEEDRRAKEILRKTTKRIGDRFETGLLWKNDCSEFPDSYIMAVKRLIGLENRLRKDPELYAKVRTMIADYLVKGYAHKATSSELEALGCSKVWYVPLNIVYNPRKQKFRLVWDARAEVRGVSLNSKLLKGPDMLTALPAVICKFREREVGFGADIKEMYHQLRIREEDKRAQRFLFRNDPSAKPEVYVMDVATFGSTSSPCSAQYVKNWNAREFAGQFPAAAKAIVENHYVDDYFDSSDTIEEAVALAKDVRYVHSKGGFELRNWVSNSREFLEAMGERKENQCVRFGEDKESGSERVLGIVWSPANDEFSFSTKLREDLVPFLSGEQLPTKRIVMSFFDPLGLLSVFTFYGKLLIQDLWRSGCEWDQQIGDEEAEKWYQWIRRLPEVEEVRIPRYYFCGGRSLDYASLQLHTFVDASQDAYGAATYIRIETDEGPICSLVMSRSKVAPLQHMSIPRLELQAATLGARLANSVGEILTLEVKRRFMWSDSKTVLSWIHSDHRRYKQFVAFRIGEIHSLTKIAKWRWVPTKCNAADALTKWEKAHSMHSDAAWFRGSGFLYQPEDCWPKQDSIAPNVAEEVRACVQFHDIAITMSIVDLQRFSKWRVLVRTVACVYRFASNCRRKKDGFKIEAVPTTEAVKKAVIKTVRSTTVPLKREEYQKAEAYLWRSAQADCFGDEIRTIKKNRQLPLQQQQQLEKSSSLHNLSPFLDTEDVLRMEGRAAQGSSLPFELRFPIILPKQHLVTDKLLEYYHHRVAHGNVESAVNEVRQRFSIQNLRAELKRIGKSCMWCKVKKCRARTPRMARHAGTTTVQPHRRGLLRPSHSYSRSKIGEAVHLFVYLHDYESCPP